MQHQKRALTPHQGAQPQVWWWDELALALAHPPAWCGPPAGKHPSPCLGKQEASELTLLFASLWFAADPFKVSSCYRDAKGLEQNVTTRFCEFLHLLLVLGFRLLKIMPEFTAVSLKMSCVLALSQYFCRVAQLMQ